MRDQGEPGSRRELGVRLAVALLAVLASLAVTTSPARAADIVIPRHGAEPTGPGAAVEHRCALYANSGGFGADCATGGSKGSLKAVLGNQEFPECKYELLTPENQDQVPYVPPQPDGLVGKLYLVTCLKGIKPDGTGDFTREAVAQWFPDSQPPPVLTPAQQQAWDAMHTAYPEPVPQFGPGSLPRVLIPTFFWLRPESGAQIERTVFDGVRDVPMRARVEQIEVTPGVEHAKLLVCPGAGTPYNWLADIYHQTSTCQYLYARSSASMPQQMYDVTVTAVWVVEYQLADGTWNELGLFPQAKVFPTPVQEIQTVVG
jgi:hypothetical protein